MNPTDAINQAMIGAIAMACFVIGAIFSKFARKGSDRFFWWFSLAFFVEGANRVAQAMSMSPNEGGVGRYSVRLLSFLLILVAILEKNRLRGNGR